MHLIDGGIGQNMEITVKILEQEYKLAVKNPDEEELYRKAAESVNGKYAYYNQKFLGRPATDILSFVAFNVCLTNLKSAKAVEALNREVAGLHEEIEAYLADKEK